MSRTNILEYSGSSYGSYFRKSNGISWCHAKAIIWDTILILEMRELRICDDGTVNVGQIINEEHKPEEVFLCSFGSYKGRLLLDVSGGCYAGYAGSCGKSTVGNMNCTNSRLKIGSYL
jgi:hypothetical protein